MLKLVRGKNAPSDSVVLSDSDFIKAALLSIAANATELSQLDKLDANALLDSFSDILELTNAVLQKENINPVNVFSHAQALREEKGTFMDKKAQKD